MSTKYPIVYLKWEDHYSESSGWTSGKSLKKKHKRTGVSIIETVGFLISESDTSVMMILSIADDEMMDGNIVILKKNIIERRVLEGLAAIGINKF
jgi:short subunit dehydrogenase-like uncharacterized protein